MLQEPYRGLNPYREIDQDIFFGRETQTEFIIDHLRAFRLTILYGGSGVGKSSLLQAGVAASLHQQARRNLNRYKSPLIAVAVFPILKGSQQEDISVSLLKKVAADIQEIDPTIQPPLSELSFVETLEAWTKLLGKDGEEGKLFIILDQAEELFLLESEEVKSYAENLARAINRFGLRVNFLISIRTSEFTKLDQFKTLIPKLMDKRIELQRLDRNSAQDAIQKPLEVYNEQYPDQAVEIDDSLVNEVLNQVMVRGEGRIEAAYLQLVMQRLWHQAILDRSTKLELQTLHDLGGAKEIARTHFKQQMQTMDRQSISSLFHYLVTPSGAQLPQTVDDLVVYANDIRAIDQEELKTEHVKELLEDLSRGPSRILRAVAGDRYEIYFDVLAEIISDWLKTQTQIRQLAQKAEQAQNEFNYSQLKALEMAIEAGEALQVILHQDQDWSTDVSTITVRRVLQNLLENIREQRSFHHPDSPIYGADISLDGKQLATASFDGRICLWNLQTMQTNPIQTLQNPSESVFYLKFSPDGKQLAVGSWDGTTCVWDLQDMKLLHSLGKPGEAAIYSVSFNPNGQLLATASQDGTVRLWRLMGSLPTAYVIQAHQSVVMVVEFDPQGERLVTTSTDPTAHLCLWDLQGNQILQWSNPNTLQFLYSAGFSADGQRLVASSFDGFVYLWDLKNCANEPTQQFQAHNAPIAHVSFSPKDNDRLMTVAWDGSVKSWNLKYKSWQTWQCDRNPIYRVMFSSNRRHVVTVASDGAAHLWNLTDYPELLKNTLLVIPGLPQTPVYCVSFSPDGQQIALASGDNIVRLWNFSSQQLQELDHHNPVYRLSFSPNGKHLATTSMDNTAWVWDVENHQLISRCEGHTKPVYCASFSPDGEQLVTASDDGTIRLWDLQGQPLGEGMRQSRGTLYYVSFSPDGQQLVTASVNGMVRLLDLQGNEQKHFRHMSAVYCLSFDSSGKLLATASGDGTARLWNMETYEQQALLRHGGTVYWVSFSPDGTLLATASSDGATRLWAVASGQKIAEFKHHQDVVYSVSFNPNGQQVATGSQDGTVKVRNIETLAQLLQRGYEFREMAALS